MYDDWGKVVKGINFIILLVGVIERSRQ
jgi:hypothetical protein